MIPPSIMMPPGIIMPGTHHGLKIPVLKIHVFLESRITLGAVGKLTERLSQKNDMFKQVCAILVE